jgi:hypothetical protein
VATGEEEADWSATTMRRMAIERRHRHAYLQEQ